MGSLFNREIRRFTNSIVLLAIYTVSEEFAGAWPFTDSEYSAHCMGLNTLIQIPLSVTKKEHTTSSPNSANGPEILSSDYGSVHLRALSKESGEPQAKATLRGSTAAAPPISQEGTTLPPLPPDPA